MQASIVPGMCREADLGLNFLICKMEMNTKPLCALHDEDESNKGKALRTMLSG